MNYGLGKKAEEKIREWLDRPEDGYCFDRIPDKMTGFYGDANICDFTLYKYPEFYYIESKSTENDRFDFSLISETQHDGLLKKSKMEHVHGFVIVLFILHKRAFLLDINDIKKLEDEGKKSINIKKIDKWTIPYKEIKTVPSRKQMLDYAKEGNVL